MRKDTHKTKIIIMNIRYTVHTYGAANNRCTHMLVHLKTYTIHVHLNMRAISDEYWFWERISFCIFRTAVDFCCRAMQAFLFHSKHSIHSTMNQQRLWNCCMELMSQSFHEYFIFRDVFMFPRYFYRWKWQDERSVPCRSDPPRIRCFWQQHLQCLCIRVWCYSFSAGFFMCCRYMVNSSLKLFSTPSENWHMHMNFSSRWLRQNVARTNV